MSKIFTYLREQDGHSAAEYALGAAVVGVVAVVSGHFLLGLLGGSANVVSNVADCVRFHSRITTC